MVAEPGALHEDRVELRFMVTVAIFRISAIRHMVTCK